ncbi:unnamed protein product [Protopolystoma xenopodis]|uniref:Uncharacterized protein n=1 Tax=Protopolystoma xenopodis TaxID=117903 RepID=A0A3S5CML8_9PLAT|nr:unnamed protein product [Protopolystoma xenopodis]
MQNCNVHILEPLRIGTPKYVCTCRCVDPENWPEKPYLADAQTAVTSRQHSKVILALSSEGWERLCTLASRRASRSKAKTPTPFSSSPFSNLFASRDHALWLSWPPFASPQQQTASGKSQPFDWPRWLPNHDTKRSRMSS